MQHRTEHDYCHIRRGASWAIALGMKVLFRLNLNSSK
jgi:hypothetical protein